MRTADAGRDARGKYRSDDLMGDLFAGPYLFLAPDLAFVLDDGRRPVGYVLGTADTAAFARAYRERWIPRLAGRYPAHLHIDLLPEVQRAGCGRSLIQTFCVAAARAGATGVHVCVVAENAPAIGFYLHLGFRPAEPTEPTGSTEPPESAGVVYLTRTLETGAA